MGRQILDCEKHVDGAGVECLRFSSIKNNLLGGGIKPIKTMNEAMCKSDEKRTLTNSIERLMSTSKRMEELANYSDTMVAKFKRIEGMIREEKKDPLPPSPTIPDIIDLFNEANRMIIVFMEKTGRNIETIVQSIE